MNISIIDDIHRRGRRERREEKKYFVKISASSAFSVVKKIQLNSYQL